MKKFLGLLCGLLLCSPCLARPGGDSSYNSSVSGGGGGSPTWTPSSAIPCQYNAGYSTTYTFTAAVPATVGVDVIMGAGNGSSPASMTVGGSSATIISAAVQTGAMFYYNNIAGTAGNIVVTMSGGANAACLAVGVLTGLASATPNNTQHVANAGVPEPFSLGTSLTVLSGGLGIIGFAEGGTAGAWPGTWTSATADTGTNATETNTNINVGLAHLTTSGTPTFACTSTCQYQGWALQAGAWK